MVESTGSDGLVRWLIGGLVVGGIVLGLLVGSYEIGYHRGQTHARSAATTAAPPSSTTTTPAGGGAGARGEELFSSDGCSACHSLNGTKGVGPTVKGLAGSRVELSDGSTVTADDTYLAKSITDPDAQIVVGYQKGVMTAGVSSFGLNSKPDDVDALVAFIKTER